MIPSRRGFPRGQVNFNRGRGNFGPTINRPQLQNNPRQDYPHNNQGSENQWSYNNQNSQRRFLRGNGRGFNRGGFNPNRGNSGRQPSPGHNYNPGNPGPMPYWGYPPVYPTYFMPPTNFLPNNFPQNNTPQNFNRTQRQALGTNSNQPPQITMVENAEN